MHNEDFFVDDPISVPASDEENVGPPFDKKMALQDLKKFEENVKTAKELKNGSYLNKLKRIKRAFSKESLILNINFTPKKVFSNLVTGGQKSQEDDSEFIYLLGNNDTKGKMTNGSGSDSYLMNVHGEKEKCDEKDSSSNGINKKMENSKKDDFNVTVEWNVSQTSVNHIEEEIPFHDDSDGELIDLYK